MTKKIYLLGIGAGLLLAAPVQADTAPVEVKTAGYHLKNRSSLALPQNTRAPFWPIGWSPTARQTTSVDAPVIDAGLKPEQFNVTSILLGSQSLAVINGRTYGEGEYLRGAKTLRPADSTPPGATAAALPASVKIRVIRISDGTVTLQAGSQALVVPLKRPRLLEKKPEEELLSQLGDN